MNTLGQHSKQQIQTTMLVSKEKYKDAIGALHQAEQEANDKQLEIESLKKTIAALKQTAESIKDADSALEIETLSGQNKELQEKNTALTLEVEKLNESLEASKATIHQLETTVEKLSNQAAAPPAKVVSESDGQPTWKSLNDFIREHKHDTMACIQRLREEGF